MLWRVNIGPRLLDMMLILETEKEERERKLKTQREKTERQTESRKESQVMTAVDQPSTQSQTGKGMWGEEKGRMSDWREECSEEKREIVFEETSGFG